MRTFMLRILGLAALFTISAAASASIGRGVPTTMASAVVNTDSVQIVNAASRLYFLDIERGLRVRVNLPLYEKNLTGLDIFQDDGRQIVVSALERRANRLYYVNLVSRSRHFLLEDSPVIEVVLTAESFAPAWSPDGSKVAYWHPRSHVTSVFDLMTLQRHVVWEPAESTTSFYDPQPVWSSDSRRLFITHQNDRIVVQFGQEYAMDGAFMLHRFKRPIWLEDIHALLKQRLCAGSDQSELRAANPDESLLNLIPSNETLVTYGLWR